MHIKLFFIYFFLAFLFSYFFFLFFFKKKICITKIDEFSNLKRKNIVSGYGILFIPLIVINFFLYQIFFGRIYLPINFIFFFTSLSLITLISYFDDLYNLDPRIRIVSHFLSTFVGLSCIPHSDFFLPIKLSILLSIIIWVYLINVTNFVDGADGFCLTNVIIFFLGIICIIHFLNLNLYSYYIIILSLPFLLIFLLFFNYPIANSFMGDSGSVFCGYIVGFVSLEIFFNGYYIYPFSLFSYPIIDVTITLIKKILKGHAPWERLGDYYFLILKKNRKKNFAISEKRLFYSTLSLNILNFFVLLFSLFLENELLSLICFFNSFLMTRLYKIFR
jgi:UDP-N-acetylmuramyl pentapeptide phosphotransferase/UDP-N-acetylglucosamine-1-phosphate transferase